MEFLTLYGLLGALVIGIVLGLTGSGGSILTVPVLVYLLSVNPVTATAYSLFVVGTTSLFGTIKNVQKGMHGTRKSKQQLIRAIYTRKVARQHSICWLKKELSMVHGTLHILLGIKLFRLLR